MTLATIRDADVRSAGGPSASAEWMSLAEAAAGRPLYGLPDVAADQGGDAYGLDGADVAAPLHIIAAPAIDQTVAGSPGFGMTLTLERPPNPDDSSLVPLVSGGVASLSVTVIPSDDELAAAASEARVEAARVFPQSVRFALGLRTGESEANGSQPAESDATEVASILIEGPNGSGALAANLTREAALAVLAAVQGQPSSLDVVADVEFRAVAPATPPLHITVDLARSHGLLGSAVDRGFMIDEAEIPGLLETLIETRAVGVEGLSEGDAPMAAGALALVLQSSLLRALLPILTRATGLEGPPRYRLGPRPADGAQMSFEQRRSEGAVSRRVTLVRSLVDVLHDLTADQPLDAFVRAVCPGPAGALEPIAMRLPRVRSASVVREPGMAALGTTSAEMPAVLRTTGREAVRANVLALSDIAIRRPGRLQVWAVNDLVLATAIGGEKLESLPVVEGDSGLWRDRVDGNKRWYAPELVVVDPDPAGDPTLSPYRFSFRVVGHDSDGLPGLEATIRLSLRLTMPSAAMADWEASGRPAAQAVPLNGLSVALQIPYRSEGGATATQEIPAIDVTLAGTDVVATISLTDKWARLAYGALSRPGFQSQPARVVVSYAFPAYIPIDDGGGRIDWGGKIATVPNFDRLTLAPPPGPDDPAPEWLAVNRLESVELPRGVRRPLSVHPAAMQLAVGHLAATQVEPAVAVHPVLVAPVHVLPPKTYGIRTQGRTFQVDALLPCAELGSLYVQVAEPGETTGDHAIGCLDAWTLGQVKLRLYEPVSVDVGPGDPEFTIYRSLQVPGRFLVVPKAYTIARYEPGEDRAYRPAMYVFSSVDAINPDRSSCIVMATLRPAVTPARRLALLDALRALHPSPSLEWPTDLSVTPEYDWAIATGGSESAAVVPAVARTPEGFQVSLATGIDGILQLKAILERGGISASVSFPLADGETLVSTLVLDLARIDGPWEAGAVDATISGANATVTNHVERPANVGEILAFKAGVRVGSVPLERRLEPAASATVTVPAGADAMTPHYTLVTGPTTIDEIRTFIEDIYTNVVFKSTVDLAGAGLSALRVEGRILGIAGSASVTLDASLTAADMGFVLPLTTYLAQPTLQYQVTAVAGDGATTAGEWHDWRLDTQGSVVVINATS